MNPRYFRPVIASPSTGSGRASASQGSPIRDALRHELSWTHYRTLLRVENEPARHWYMKEAANQNWSSRALDRQIGITRMLEDVQVSGLWIGMTRKSMCKVPGSVIYSDFPTYNLPERGIGNGEAA